MLAASVAAQAGASVAINGPAFLIPSLQEDRGLSLTQAGTLAAMPIAGVMVTLFLWGLAVDRVGERTVLLAGLGGTVVLGVVATQVHDTVLLGVTLFVVGMFAACTGSASGRIVVGWFPPRRRGLAMGIRQMAQPLGVAIAAATIAVVADRADVSAALWVPVVATTLAFVAVLLIVLDPPRPTADGRTDPEPLPGRRLPGPDPRRLCAAGRAAVPGVDLLAHLAGAGARLVPRLGGGSGRRPPTCSAPWAGSRSASSRTWSAPGCARCDGSPSRRPRRWGCWR